MIGLFWQCCFVSVVLIVYTTEQVLLTVVLVCVHLALHGPLVLAGTPSFACIMPCRVQVWLRCGAAAVAAAGATEPTVKHAGGGGWAGMFCLVLHQG